jgi:transcription antitermination factor NusG
MSYVELQQKWIKKNNIKVGDVVKIIRKAEYFEGGWCNSWKGEMFNLIGKNVKIFKLSCGCGGGCGIEIESLKGNFRFPYFVLEPVKEGVENKKESIEVKTTFKVGDRVKVLSDNIYGIYQRWADEYNIKNFKREFNPDVGDIGEIVAVGPHFDFDDRMLCAVYVPKKDASFIFRAIEDRLELIVGGNSTTYKENNPESEDVCKMSYRELEKKWIKENNIEVGDKVKIIRRASDYEEGWNNIWTGEMLEYIGKEVTVYDLGGCSRGIKIEEKNFCFPYFVLEPVKKQKEVKKSAEVKTNFKVGDKVQILSDNLYNRYDDWANKYGVKNFKKYVSPDMGDVGEIVAVGPHLSLNRKKILCAVYVPDKDTSFILDASEEDVELIEDEKIEGKPSQQKENIMSEKETKNGGLSVLENLFNNNKDAAKSAAELEAAHQGLRLLKKAAKEALPATVSSFVDTPLGSLVLANLLNQVLPNFTNNQFALDMSQAALVSAYQELIGQLNISEFVNKFVSGATK